MATRRFKIKAVIEVEVTLRDPNYKLGDVMEEMDYSFINGNQPGDRPAPWFVSKADTETFHAELISKDTRKLT